MKKAMIVSIIIFVILSIILISIPRQNPGTYVSRLWQNGSDWGNVKVLDVQHLSGYSVVHIQYEAKNRFQPPVRWVVKDRTKLKDMPPGNSFSQWEGYVYLVKQGLYSWRVIQ